MNNKVIDEGIVLRRINYGESDKVVTILCKENGKISVFARGVRKPKSKLSAGVELLSKSEIGFIKSKNQLNTLVSSRLVNFYGDSLTDYKKTEQVFNSLKSLEKHCDDNSGKEYFSTLETYLDSISDPDYDVEIVEMWFRLRVLDISGQLGEINVKNIKENIKNYHFNYDTHHFEAHSSGVFSENDIKLLKLLKNNEKPIKLEKPSDSQGQLSLLTNNIYRLSFI